MRPLKYLALRLQGVDPDELERELREMDEAKARRDADRRRLEGEARRRYVDMRMRRGDQWR